MGAIEAEPGGPVADEAPAALPAPAAAPEPPPDPVSALELRLGVALGDRVTALAALTHKSWVNEHRGEPQADNERLEFLGDAVIDLAVSHRLMERFPAAREGDLSKMRAAVVDEQGLAGLARTLDLGPLLRLGRGEELTGGRRKASVLADAMEAVVAAVYLDAGLAGVLALVDRFLGEAFERAAAGTLDRDYKTQLQELAQSRLRATPRYRVVAERGPDHAKVFEVEIDLRGEPLGAGSGRSKKDAEQAAARRALEGLAARSAGPAGPAEAPWAAAVADPPEPGGEGAGGGAGAGPAGESPGTPAAAEAEPVRRADGPEESRPALPAEMPEAVAAAMDGAIEPVVDAPPERPERSARVPARRPAGKAKSKVKVKARKPTGASRPRAGEPKGRRQGSARPGTGRKGAR